MTRNAEYELRNFDSETASGPSRSARLPYVLMLLSWVVIWVVLIAGFAWAKTVERRGRLRDMELNSVESLEPPAKGMVHEVSVGLEPAGASEKTCASCGTANPPAANFCRSCGGGLGS